ncbi:hypothetical protein MMC30_008483 [Trapelia coarctata]|nr:hypothetical protein [Trapelia coarctata]
MTATLLLLSLPKQLFVGIDLLTFTSSPRFHGITGIPPGCHFLYTSPTTSLSIRHGTWLHIPSHPTNQSALVPKDTAKAPDSPDYSRSAEQVLHIFKWSNDREELVHVTDDADTLEWRDRLLGENDAGRRAREMLLPYRQTITQSSTTSISSIATKNGQGNSGNTSDIHAANCTAVEESTDWPQLTAHVSHTLLAHFTRPSAPPPDPPIYTLTTTACAPQDRDDIPGLSAEDMRDGLFGGEECDLGCLAINLKRTWRQGAVGRERTEGARDRSWALKDVVDRNTLNPVDWDKRGEKGKMEGGGRDEEWGSVVLGEMELCFLMTLTLSNYSCLCEWKRILELVLTSRSLIIQRPQFFKSFLELLVLQLRHCNDVEGGLFDVHAGGDGNFLLELLKTFERGLEEVVPERDRVEGAAEEKIEELKDVMEEVEEWVKKEWGWELGDDWLRRGMVELEDGERVEVETADMEEEDERGEYAPVVVEL